MSYGQYFDEAQRTWILYKSSSRANTTVLFESPRSILHRALLSITLTVARMLMKALRPSDSCTHLGERALLTIPVLHVATKPRDLETHKSPTLQPWQFQVINGPRLSDPQNCSNTTTWLFLQIGGPPCGCPYDKRPIVFMVCIRTPDFQPVAVPVRRGKIPYPDIINRPPGWRRPTDRPTSESCDSSGSLRPRDQTNIRILHSGLKSPQSKGDSRDHVL